MDGQNSLALISKAKAMLMKCTSLEGVINARDFAETIRNTAKMRKESLEIQNHAAEIRLRAERKAGAMIAEMPKHNGDPRLHDATRLSDLGIEKTQSHRWQQVASIPDDEFESCIAETMADGDELTTVKMLKLAAAQREPRPPKPFDYFEAVENLKEIIRSQLGKWPDDLHKDFAGLLVGIGQQIETHGKVI